MSNKKGKEAKVERMTWFAMILVFILLSFLPDVTVVPDTLIPFTIAAILILSGVYQLTQKWPVSPFTWIIATLLIGVATYRIFFFLPVDLVLVSLIGTVIVIVVGIVSNEG